MQAISPHSYELFLSGTLLVTRPKLSKEENTNKSTVWLVPNTCAQPYIPGSRNQRQLFRLYLDSSAWLRMLKVLLIPLSLVVRTFSLNFSPVVTMPPPSEVQVNCQWNKYDISKASATIDTKNRLKIWWKRNRSFLVSFMWSYTCAAVFGFVTQCCG